MKVWIEELHDWIFLPVLKSQLVYWLMCKYPNENQKKFERYTCKRLKAICISCCRRVGRQREANDNRVQSV